MSSDTLQQFADRLREWKHKRKPLLLHRGSCGRGKARGNVFRRLCCVPCESCGRSQPKLGVPANLPNRNACRQSEPEMMVWHHSQRQRSRYRRTMPVVPQLGHVWGGVAADWWASTWHTVYRMEYLHYRKGYPAAASLFLALPYALVLSGVWGKMSGATKRLYLVLRAHCVASDGGDGSFLPIGEVHPREFADMAGLHPGAARKIRGRLEAAHLLTMEAEGWFLPFEEGQARHSVPRHLKKRRKRAIQYRVRKETRRWVPSPRHTVPRPRH